MGGDLTGKRVGVLGLTFKPNTDDMRDAPSLDIIPALQAMGAVVQAFDPEGHEARQLLVDVDFKTGPYEAAEDAEAAGEGRGDGVGGVGGAARLLLGLRRRRRWRWR